MKPSDPMPPYATRDEAILYEIAEPLGEYAPDFDIERIADAVIGWDAHSFYCTVEPEDFWPLVQRCAL